MTDTQEDKATRGKGLTPGHWIGISTIAVVVLGGVLSWGLGQQNARFSENNTRLANVESATTNMAEGLARVEGSIKTTNEHLSGFEQRVDQRFTQVDERFNRLEMNIDERFNRMDDRLDRIEMNMDDRLGRIEMNMDDRLGRIETNIDRLIQLHLQAGTTQPAASRHLDSERRRQNAGTRR